MINGVKKLALVATTVALFSCGGRSDNTADNDTVSSPGEVDESDRVRYNINAPDEMIHEMQDTTVADTPGAAGKTSPPDTLADQ